MTLFTGLRLFPSRRRTPPDMSIPTALARLLERIHAAGADSIGLLGSTGGYAFLSRGRSGGVRSRLRWKALAARYR